MTEPTPYPSGAPTPYLSVSTDRVPLTGSLQPAPEPEPEPTPEPEPAPAGQAPQSEQSVRLRPAVPPSDAMAVKVRHMRVITVGYQKHYGLGSEGEDDGSARS
jgi:hypothetical protein